MNEYENIKNQVLDKIQAGKINMRPRFYFIFQLLALTLVAFVTLLTSSLLISFIIFGLVESGRLFLFGFGWRGLYIFFYLFPWSILAIEIVLIVLLQGLIKKFKIGYRSSAARLLFVIFCLSVAVSVLIDNTSLHPTLLKQSEQQGLPLLGGFYRELHHSMPRQEIFRGVISGFGTSSFILTENTEESDTAPNQAYTIVIPRDVQMSSSLVLGDLVFVAGYLMPNNMVEAYGLKRLSPCVSCAIK